MNTKTTPCPHCNAREGWTRFHAWFGSGGVWRSTIYNGWATDPLRAEEEEMRRRSCTYVAHVCNACGEAVS